jgi:hypothetical protein
MTAEAIESSDAAPLDVGWVLRSMLVVLRRRLIDLLMIGAVFVMAPLAFAALWTGQELAVSDFLASMLGLIFTGATCLIVFQELSGGARVGPLTASGRAARRFGSLWWVSLIYGLMVLLGCVLLVVPGLIALVAFIPASPAVMVENATSSAAMQRAWELSRGSRLRIGGLCGLITLAILAWLLLGYAVEIGLVLVLGPDSPVDRFAFAPFLALGVTALMNVFAATVYAGLRLAAEGGLDRVPEVFA